MLLVVHRTKKIDRVNSCAVSDALYGLEGHVALTALYRSRKGPMHSQDVRCEGFLRIAARLTNSSQIVAESSLQVTFHGRNADVLLLYGLQPYM